MNHLSERSFLISKMSSRELVEEAILILAHVLAQEEDIAPYLYYKLMEMEEVLDRLVLTCDDSVDYDERP